MYDQYGFDHVSEFCPILYWHIRGWRLQVYDSTLANHKNRNIAKSPFCGDAFLLAGLCDQMYGVLLEAQKNRQKINLSEWKDALYVDVYSKFDIDKAFYLRLLTKCNKNKEICI